MLSNIAATAKQPSRVDEFAFYFCLIDVFFLPYASFLTVAFSLPVLVLWIIIRSDVLLFGFGGEFKAYLLYAFLVLFSSVLGGIMHDVIRENISHGIISIQILGYYFLFSYYLTRYQVNTSVIWKSFIFFIALMCILYNIDKQLYFSIARVWNQRGISTAITLYDNFEGYRFSFVWMDPNNISYMMVAIVAFILLHEKVTMIEKVLVFIVLGLVLISSMSSGGMIALLAEVVSIILCEIFMKRGAIRISFKTRVKLGEFVSACIMPIVAIFLIKIWNWYRQSEIGLESINRLETNTADSRYAIWNRIFENTNFALYVFFGYGSITFLNGKLLKPHNGHLYIILSYGMIAYAIFMYIVFRKAKQTPLQKYLWIIPVFLGFTANIMISEVKLAGVIMFMVACNRSSKYLEDRSIVFRENNV